MERKDVCRESSRISVLDGTVFCMSCGRSALTTLKPAIFNFNQVPNLSYLYAKLEFDISQNEVDGAYIRRWKGRCDWECEGKVSFHEATSYEKYDPNDCTEFQ